MARLMKSQALWVILLGWACVATAGASDSKIEGALKRQYHDRTLTLRHPLLSGTQQYDSTGKVLSGGEEGAWSLYSGIRIRKISVHGDQLLVEGHRTYFLYSGRSEVSYVPDKSSPIKMEVRLEHPCTSVDEASAILAAIFAFKDEDLLDSVPIYWKPVIADKTKLKLSDDISDRAKETSKPIANTSKPAPNPALKVTMPRALYTPEPQFTDQARKFRIQGVVVLRVIITREGEVKHVRISRAAGMGLDEAAVATVQTWKFEPGMKDGKPVPVEMALEISFNLYDRPKHK